jgi:hypothetical protein
VVPPADDDALQDVALAVSPRALCDAIQQLEAQAGAVPAPALGHLWEVQRIEVDEDGFGAGPEAAHNLV